ncbi:MAG: hypothetical protein V3T17_09565 [Pseudomonadales bacterium]
MAKLTKQSMKHNVGESNAWVLTTKRAGDQVAGWIIDRVFEQNIRRLESSERCTITSFCYPTGAKLVRAKLLRA